MRTSGKPEASAVASAMPLGSFGSFSFASLNQRSNNANGSLSAKSAASSGGGVAVGSYLGEGGMRSSPDKESCSPSWYLRYKCFERDVPQHVRPPVPRHHLGRKPWAGAWLRGGRLPARPAADGGGHSVLAEPARAGDEPVRHATA